MHVGVVVVWIVCMVHVVHVVHVCMRMCAAAVVHLLHFVWRCCGMELAVVLGRPHTWHVLCCNVTCVRDVIAVCVCVGC